MKTVVILTTFMILAGAAAAQQSAAPQTMPNTTAAATAASSAIPEGTLMVVELKTKLDTKKAKVGDPVSLEVSQDAKSPDGRVVVPKKSKLMGKVTAVAPSTKEKPEARLSVLIDSANVKGQSMPMTGYMVPPFKAPAPPQADMSMIGAANQKSDTGAMQKNDPTAGKGPGGGDESGLGGIKLKLDEKGGTFLVSDRKNIVLESGTMFQVKEGAIQPAAAK